MLQVSTWLQRVQVNEARIMANIQTLHAAKGHLTHFKALDPDEGPSASDREEDARLHCTRATDGAEELELLDGAAVAGQLVGLDGRPF